MASLHASLMPVKAMFMRCDGILFLMEMAMASIEGASLDALVEALKNVMGNPLFLNDRTAIFAVERYYMRIDSNLMCVFIADFSTATKCDVRVLVGGGGEGILGISWRAESDDLLETTTKLWQICTASGWQFTRADPAGGQTPT